MAVAYHSVLTGALGDWKVYVAGRGKESARAFYEKTGATLSVGPLSEQLDRLPSDVKIAIVAVQVEELAPVVRLLLAAGFERILLEKPGALHVEQATELAQLDADDRIRVAYNRRFLQSSNYVRQAIREDGGVTSFSMDFTELSERIATSHHHSTVKANWVFANSSHVIDLAFDLSGAKEDLTDVNVAAALSAGSLDWHPNGARFSGCGRVGESTLFSWNADWCSGGGWSIDLCTPARRLVLRPLETVVQQARGQFSRVAIDLPAEEGSFKPGLPGMLRYFLLDERTGKELPTMRQQAERLRKYDGLIRPK